MEIWTPLFVTARHSSALLFVETLISPEFDFSGTFYTASWPLRSSSSATSCFKHITEKNKKSNLSWWASSAQVQNDQSIGPNQPTHGLMNQMNGPTDGEVLVVVAERVKRMHVCFEKRRKCSNHEHSGSGKLGLFLRKNMRNKCRVGANKAGRHPEASLLSGRPFNCCFLLWNLTHTHTMQTVPIRSVLQLNTFWWLDLVFPSKPKHTMLEGGGFRPLLLREMPQCGTRRPSCWCYTPSVSASNDPECFTDFQQRSLYVWHTFTAAFISNRSDHGAVRGEEW